MVITAAVVLRENCVEKFEKAQRSMRACSRITTHSSGSQRLGLRIKRVGSDFAMGKV